MPALTLHLTADTTVDNLAGFLKRASGAAIECSVAPYNQAAQTLMGAPQASQLLLWTTPDQQLRSFRRLLNFEAVPPEDIYAEVDGFAAMVRAAAAKYANVFFMSWTFPPDRRWPLGLASKPGFGAADILARANLRLVDALADAPNVHIIDLGLLQAGFPKALHDARLNIIGRMRFTPDFLKYVAEQIHPVIEASIKPSKKIVICDLDNTLWGGVVGDDGVEGLRLGGNDPVGEAHLKLQQELKALNNRGILLAISSKNSPEIAFEAFRTHPNMLLKEADFSARRINWDDKAANILSLLEELNLLPSAAVFLDDNPTERSRIRDAIPDLLVPELPKDVALWPGLVGGLGGFETLTLSREDVDRAANYRSESERRESMTLHADLGEWLRSLDIVLTARALRGMDLARTVQLLNKTNQFNLHTRRMSESEFADWCAGEDRRCYTFSVADRFGDSGLTGLVTVEKEDGGWRVVDYVMSCRVMGKGVEDAIIAETISRTGAVGALRIGATPTAKNGPAREFVSRIAPQGVVPASFVRPEHIKVVSEPDGGAGGPG
ncbi:MAG: HAD-IIIC family phosphatase [Hyphomonadaceae bacterium]|nr:HAD-IIIC family phosphatase [Hyphomonadaceae bacterium]